MPIDHDEAEKQLHKLLADRPDALVDLFLATRTAVHLAAKKSGHQSSELLYSSYAVSDAFTSVSYTHLTLPTILLV